MADAPVDPRAAAIAAKVQTDIRKFIEDTVDNSDIADVLIAKFAPIDPETDPKKINKLKAKHIQAALRAIVRAEGVLPDYNHLRPLFKETGLPLGKNNAVFNLYGKKQVNDKWSSISSELIDLGLDSLRKEGNKDFVNFQNEVYVHREKAALSLLTFAKIPVYDYRGQASKDSEIKVKAAKLAATEEKRRLKIEAVDLSKLADVAKNLQLEKVDAPTVPPVEDNDAQNGVQEVDDEEEVDKEDGKAKVVLFVASKKTFWGYLFGN